MACLSLAKGETVSPLWLNQGLYNARAVIHKNGAVELQYGTGRRSFSCAGKDAENHLRELGLSNFISEEIDGTTILHGGHYPMKDRLMAMFRRKRLNYDWSVPLPDLGLSPLDDLILSRILSGDEADRENILRDYPHKVSVQSPTGRTVYLKLDNPTEGGVAVLRLKGVMPKRGFWGKKTFWTIHRKIEMDGNVPKLMAFSAKTSPFGTMTFEAAETEYEFANAVGGDNPIAVGAYTGGAGAFVIYGMIWTDVRIDGIELNRHHLDGIGVLLKIIHDKKITHGSLRLGNVGIQDDWLVFRDFEDSLRWPITATIEERAALRFMDVIGPLFDLVRTRANYSELGRAFLEGYFRRPVSRDLMRECVSPEMVEKIGDMEAGFRTEIPYRFPVLFEELMRLDALHNIGTTEPPDFEMQIKVMQKTGESL